MNIVVDKQPNCVATLRAEIPADKVNGQRNQIVQGYASKARVPGYRPGKAPISVIAKRFEKQITQELNENLFHLAIDEAIKQESLKVLDIANPNDLAIQPDGSMTFATTLTIAPEIELPEYKGIKVTVPVAEVPDQDFEDQLKSLQERFAEFNDIEGRAAEMADFAVIDYSSTVEGKPTEEYIGKSAGYIAGREGFWLRLDEKAFLPGFADQVVGMNAGDSKDITLTLPADFPVEALKEKEITFATTVKELKQATLPELDDELAEKLAPGKSMDEIKDIIRDNMKNERQRRIDDMKINQIVEHFNANTSFELPEKLVTQETQSQADMMVQRGIQQGMSEDDIQSQQEELFKSAGNQAITNIRTNFILQEIAAAENIVASDQELIGQLSQMAQQRNQAPKKFIKQMQQEGRLPSIRNQILIGKAIDFVVKHAEVEESSDATIS